jgi:hypothetical protein
MADSFEILEIAQLTALDHNTRVILLRLDLSRPSVEQQAEVILGQMRAAVNLAYSDEENIPVVVGIDKNIEVQELLINRELTDRLNRVEKMLNEILTQKFRQELEEALYE